MVIASLTNIDHEIARFHLINFFASFWPRIHQFSWWMDHWTRLGNRNSNSLNLPTRHRKQVGSLTVYARRTQRCVSVFFCLLWRYWARGGAGCEQGPGSTRLRGGGRGPGRRRRTGSRGVITGLCAANHSSNAARMIRDSVRLTYSYLL